MSLGKYKVAVTGFFTVLFFVLLIIFLASAENLSTGVWIITGTIAVSVIVVLVLGIVFQVRSNKKLSQLPKDYRETYLNACELINLGTVNPSDRNEAKSMILEIFEHAHLEKRDVNEVIGGSLETYVNNFLEESKQRNTYINIAAYSVFLFLFFILFMKLYIVLRHAEFSNVGFETEVLDVGIVLTYALISFIFYPSLMILIQQSSKRQWRGIKRAIVLIPTIIPFGLFMILVNVENESLRNFLDQDLMIFGNMFTFFFGIVIAVSIVALFGFVPAIRLKK